MGNLLAKFRRYIETNSLAAQQDRILLTVSGGVDSMVLLDLFVQSGYNVGVAHCNFSLRGEESDEDELLVKQRAEEYDVPHYNIRFDTTAEMERTSESMEMAARRLRYDWFNELCQEHGYNAIAIAHHADDSIETFFINLFRGTGLRGLTGIKQRRGVIIRPLSFATRREILEYAATQHIPYREDSSNRSTKYLRNKIRLGLIPQLREISPKFTELMGRNISRLTETQHFISSAIDIISDEIVEQCGELQILHIDRIPERLPSKFVVYEILSSRFGFKGDLVDSLMRALELENTGRRVYSRDYVAYVDRRNIVVTHIGEEDSCSVEIESGAGRAYCANATLFIENIVIDLIDTFDLGRDVAMLDYDKLSFPLILRRWREGDSFVPLGMDGHKKVSDLLIDEKVSMADKRRQFVLLSGDEIVWVVGRRIDDRYRITDESETILKITREIV